MNAQLNSRIESAIASSDVVLFMKGSPAQPQCGFSAAVVEILNGLVDDYATVDVLEDPEIREGVKIYSKWPTIPQLYVQRRFVGGCDIVKQMFNSGELHDLLGIDPPDRSAPRIQITDTAAAAIRQALRHQPENAVHLTISPTWDHQFQLAPAQGHEIKATSNGIDILLDLGSARRAEGLFIDMVDTPQGAGFNIRNPNAPPPVREITPHELKLMLDAAAGLYLFDVRQPEEREKAHIEGSRLLDQQAVDLISSLNRNATLVFYCHHGPRSHAAADYFRQQGFTDVHNLAGGIDAWSLQVDPAVPRY